MLKTKEIINTSYKYLEKDKDWNRNKSSKESAKHKYFKTVEEQLCIIDIDKLDIPFTAFAEQMEAIGEEMHLKIHTMHEDIFNAMHTI